MLPVFVVAACGAQVDGDQWHRVAVINDGRHPVTVAGRSIAPGRTASVRVNQNSGSARYDVTDQAGHRLGCLPVDEDAHVSVSSLPACPAG